MALKSELGFGMMRLPVLNGNPTDFDYEHLNRMVDTYLEAGFNYFDTSFVYHNGKSEEAVRKAVVERYPRESIRIATKFPTFFLKPGDEIVADIAPTVLTLMNLPIPVEINGDNLIK